MLVRGQLNRHELDALARPRFYAQHLVHHGCARNEYYEFKASAEVPGDMGCMMEHMGCKGTQAHADCNIRPWNGGGSCLTGGYPCIRCTEPGFEEPGHPFMETPKLAGIPHRLAHGYAEGVVCGVGRAFQISHTAACARKCAG